MYSLERILLNIVENYKFLKEDFTGISFNLTGIIGVIESFLLSVIIILIFYLIGKKLKHLFFKNYNTDLEYFVNIALGYIAVGTGIAILGTFSFLYSSVLLTYFFIVIGIALYPFDDLNKSIKYFFGLIRESYLSLKINKWIYMGVFAFVLISLLRLIPPEIGEDAVGYHTDLPFLYLKSHTMIIESKEIQRVIPVPQLGEMTYLVAEFLGIRDASRYVHFMFYFLIVILFFYISSNKKNTVNGIVASLLFVTAPVIIRHASKANVDFQALFCWLLSVIIIARERKYSPSSIILSGIFFGGALATKLWAIAFFPTFLLYIFLTQKIKLHSFKLIVLFVLFSLTVSSVWYIRAYIITGNPIFPAFSNNDLFYLESNRSTNLRYVGFNKLIFSYSNIIAYSPLFFLGIIFLFNYLPELRKSLKRSGYFLFCTLLTIEHLLIYYYLPRYLLNLYSIGVIIISSGIGQFIGKNGIRKYVFLVTFFVLFFYYFVNTILVLPYGFGWADKNKYLTRIFSKDSSSYYDFNHLFNKHITKSDLVATYRLAGFYYANFEYIDIGYIFDKNHRSFDLLRQKGVTKLIVFGGDTEWFCKQLKLTGCNPYKYKLLASYQPGLRYLYSINEK